MKQAISKCEQLLIMEKTNRMLFYIFVFYIYIIFIYVLPDICSAYYSAHYIITHALYICVFNK